MNVIARLEFELSYTAVQHVNHYTAGSSSPPLCFMVDKTKTFLLVSQNQGPEPGQRNRLSTKKRIATDGQCNGPSTEKRTTAIDGQRNGPSTEKRTTATDGQRNRPSTEKRTTATDRGSAAQQTKYRAKRTTTTDGQRNRPSTEKRTTATDGQRATDQVSRYEQQQLTGSAKDQVQKNKQMLYIDPRPSRQSRYAPV